MSQNISTRSSEFNIDLKNNALIDADIPVVNWIKPIPEINFSEDGKFHFKLTVDSENPLKSVTIEMKNMKTGERIGMRTVLPGETELNHMELDKNLSLVDGELTVNITAENIAGIKTMTSKKIYVGASAIATVSKLNRTDYALLFATDKYENWGDLVNPIFDSRTISEILRRDYGFEVEVVENATQNEILKKIREYSQKEYKPMDQLLIFFAGHGTYDQTFGEGFVVTTESLVNDEGKTSYLSHNRLRSIVNNIPSQHIFLTMDVCFGGTFDEQLASARGMDEIYKEKDQSEYISQKLLTKTRKYLTSGGKTYVSDGIEGQHSPFARKFIEALNSQGGSDGILTVSELYTYVEKLSIQPRLGSFGDNQLSSDFLFVVK